IDRLIELEPSHSGCQSDEGINRPPTRSARFAKLQGKVKQTFGVNFCRKFRRIQLQSCGCAGDLYRLCDFPDFQVNVQRQGRCREHYTGLLLPKSLETLHCRLNSVFSGGETWNCVDSSPG